MNWKIIVLAGLAFYAVQWILGFITGPLLHNGILADDYQATAAFWRPELMQQPPDMVALLPRWLTTGVFGAFIIAGIYGFVRGSFSGSGVMRGLKYGFALALLAVAWMAGYTGIFDLPDTIWAWWAAESFLYYLVGGVVLGWVAEKVAPSGAAT